MTSRPTDALAATLTRATLALAAAVALIGAVVLAAWVFRWEPVLRLHASQGLMQVNTALLFVASAATLAAGARGARLVQAAGGVAMLALAVPTLLQFVIGGSLGVDTLFWTPAFGRPGWPAGRMGPASALAFTAIGGVAAVAPVARLRAPAAGIVAAALVAMSGFALVENLLGRGTNLVWGGLARMAVHAAIGFALVGGGLGCLAWRDGVRPGRPPAWLPWGGASVLLTLTGLLATLLVTVFPADAGVFVLVTALAMGLALAVLVFGALRLSIVARERAAQLEASSAALALSEVRHRAVFEQAAAGMVEIAIDGRILRANRRFCELVGRTPEAIAALRLSDITHPDDAEQDRRHYDEALRDALPRDGWLKRYVRPDGAIVWAHVSGSLVRGADGAPLYLVGVIQDVTERVEAQRALDRTQSRLMAFVEHTPGAVAMFDRDLRYVAVSRRWVEDYQLGDRDVIGQHHYDVFPEIRHLPEWQAIHQRCLAGAVERSDEDHFVRTDGRDEWLRWEVRPWTDERDRIGGIIMLTEVITPRKLAERALRESERRLRLALENASHGLWDWQIDTGEVILDERWWRILGYRPGELPGTLETWERTIHPEDAGRVAEVLQTALASDDVAYDVDYRALCKDGTVVWINTRGRVQSRDAGGRPLRMMGTIHDITQRKRSEDRIRASLEEKEVLLREIHHRVKNNLAVISSLFFLESTTTDSPEALRVLEESRNRIQSMALVHESLYRSENLAGVDFGEYAAALARQLLGTMRQPGRAVHLQAETTVTPLPIDTAIPCGLILNELLTNCLKHAFPGPDLDRTPVIALEVSRAGDGSCTLAVRDNGVGMNGVDPVQSRTMGLRLVRSLAQQVDGELAFEPLAPGTRVRLTLRPS